MTQPAKHTPGPWAVDSEVMILANVPIQRIRDSNGREVVRVQSKHVHLIAAATAMYEELGKCVSLIRALQERLNAHGEMCNFDEEEIASAIAALAQAEGKQ